MELFIMENELSKKSGEKSKNLAAKELAQEVKRLRELARWTQGELAEKVGVSQPVISDMELGRYNFPLDSVIRLAKAFGKTPYEFIAIYLGDNPDQFTIPEKNLLDSIIALVNTYQIKKTTQLTQEQQVAKTNRRLTDLAQSNATADATPDIVKPQNLDSDTDQEPVDSNPTNNSR
jgi:transcriptional regulator with XRE-family HTH domain